MNKKLKYGIAIFVGIGVLGAAIDASKSPKAKAGKTMAAEVNKSDSAKPALPSQPKNDDPVYVEKLFSKQYEKVYILMKKNGLVSDKDGADRAKLAAIVAGGFGPLDNDPCGDSYNENKCLVQIKETLSNEKYKAKLAELVPRIKPLPTATDKERQDAAAGRGTPLCEQAVLKGIAIPSTASFTWEHKLDEYKDGTFVKIGSLTHKNAYGQPLKKEYECRITMSKRGFDVVSAKIISLTEVK